jgi:hypothetical protein
VVVRQSLRVFTFALVSLTAIAWASSWYCGSVLHLPWPFDYPLFDPHTRFSDLTDFYAKIRNLDGGGEALGAGRLKFNYPAPCAFVYAYFIRLFPDPVLAYSLHVGVAALAALFVLWLALRRGRKPDPWVPVALAAAPLCSYPFLFLIDRGNVEGVMWIFVCGGIVLFMRGRFWPSAACLAAAACIKPFPLLLFALFVPRRKYYQIAAAVAGVLAVNLIALDALGPTVLRAYRGLTQGSELFFDHDVLIWWGNLIGFDHSLFSCVKQFAFVFATVRGINDGAVWNLFIGNAYPYYFAFAVLLAVCCGIYFWRKPVLNQLFALVLLMLILPPVS